MRAAVTKMRLRERRATADQPTDSTHPTLIVSEVIIQHDAKSTFNCNVDNTTTLYRHVASTLCEVGDSSYTALHGDCFSAAAAAADAALAFQVLH